VYDLRWPTNELQNTGTKQIAKDEQEQRINAYPVLCRNEPPPSPKFPLLSNSIQLPTFQQPAFFNKKVEMSPWMFIQSSPTLEQHKLFNQEHYILNSVPSVPEFSNRSVQTSPLNFT